MSLEVRFWRRIRNELKSFGHFQRHEDKFTGGIPDLSYGVNGVSGWIELKVLPAWPVRDNTVVKIPHFTKLQRNWLITRGKVAGHCWFFLKVVNDYILIPYTHITMNDHLTQRELIKVAKRYGGYWHRHLNYEELQSILEKH